MAGAASLAGKQLIAQPIFRRSVSLVSLAPIGEVGPLPQTAPFSYHPMGEAVMQLDPREHFREIVEPAIADYQQAEADLSRAALGGDKMEIQRASLRALRLGGVAVLYLHHFADMVARRTPSGLTDFSKRVPREVEEAGQVLIARRGYGRGAFGEGKFGGVDEVWILARSGQRPLTEVLTFVRDVWAKALFGSPARLRGKRCPRERGAWPNNWPTSGRFQVSG
jgi:hypothetical protein